MYQSVESFVEEKEKQISIKLERIKQIKELKALYPDLAVYRNSLREFDYYLISESVNSKVNLYDIPYNCYDLVVQVFPYINTAFGNIYSWPCSFHVGTYDSNYYIKPIDDWEKNLRGCDISENVIEGVSEFLKDNIK